MVNKMNIEAMAMEKFQKYQSDWTYPVQVRRSFMVNGVKGKCVSFQAAIKLTLFTGQCFGLMPVIGISEYDATKIRFTTKSFRFFYAIVTLILLFILNVLCLVKTFKDTDSSLGSNTSLIFHLTTWIIGLLFLRMATRWPQLCLRIAKTETADPNMDYGLIRRCNFACFSILFLALLEHSLSDLYGFTIAIDCHPNINLYESFNVLSFPWIFQHVTYNHFYGVLTQFTNIQCTFNWNFGDVFVICMSLYLTSRLDQVNLRIISVKGRYVPSSYWRTMREDYSRACNLVRSVDDVIGGVIFISFANNLFFICLQLLHSLAEGFKSTPRCSPDTELDERPFKGYEQAVYFAFSFVFLMVRSVAVSLVAARVHTASKAPAMALYDVNSPTYCFEIQRFLEQIHGDTVALSGLQFFNVKRGLVLAVVQLIHIDQSLRPQDAGCIAPLYGNADALRQILTSSRVTHRFDQTIAGTIVTYELVLMQFAGVSPTSTTPV